MTRLPITRAMEDPRLFLGFVTGSAGATARTKLKTWQPWRAALQCLYGLDVTSMTACKVIQACTGRPAYTMPRGGFDTALYLTGRRSGKSRTAAVIGAYEAVLAGHEDKLAAGENGVVAVVAPTKAQGRIVKDYLHALFDSTPMLRGLIVRETQTEFELATGVRIAILPGDWRTVRGYTLLAAIIDEAAFFGHDAESKVRSDTELIRAIKPSLATTRGKLIAISSPYARKGWCYDTWNRHYGKNDSTVLVWQAPSRTMNPTLAQSIVDEALAEDYQAARSEYLGEFRDDIAEFVPRSLVEALVVEGRRENLPRDGTTYHAFCDMSGGRKDDAVLAIGHRRDETVIVDLLRRWRPPFNPHGVIGEMAECLRPYRVQKLIGDNYAAEYTASGFGSAGVRYERSDRPKAALYVELLPRLTSQQVELPDDDALVDQLASLERRTRSGGKDIIDHPPGGHDDLANALAGVVVASVQRQRRKVGAIRFDSPHQLTDRRRLP